MQTVSGVAYTVGERFDDPAYFVTKGKARRYSTAGLYLPRAVDLAANAGQSFAERDGDGNVVEILEYHPSDDVWTSYYPQQRRTACACDEAAEDGCCPHQLATLLAHGKEQSPYYRQMESAIRAIDRRLPGIRQEAAGMKAADAAYV